MLLSLLVMYVWAGATTAMAMFQFAEIRQHLNESLPVEERLERSVKGTPNFLTFVTIMATWPVVLPLWIAERIKNAA